MKEENVSVINVLDWIFDNLGPTVAIIVVFMCVVFAAAYFCIKVSKANNSTTNTAYSNSAPVFQHSKLVGDLNTGAKNDYNHTGDNVAGHKIIFCTNDALNIENAKNKETLLRERGNLPLIELKWKAISKEEVSLISILNSIAPCRVVSAYESECFVLREFGPVCRAYAVETARAGYIRRVCGVYNSQPAFTDGVWPYYIITVNAQNCNVEKMTPSDVITHKEIETEGMLQAKLLFTDLKNKVGEAPCLLPR